MGAETTNLRAGTETIKMICHQLRGCTRYNAVRQHQSSSHNLHKYTHLTPRATSMEVSPSVCAKFLHQVLSVAEQFQQFVLRSTLQRHTSSITNLCINPDGRTLISCGRYSIPYVNKIENGVTLGEDALVVLWDLETGAQLQDISCPFNGPITVAVWLPAIQGSATAFAFGCADGSIHVYAQLPHQVSYYNGSYYEANLQA